jgi:radical SAM protein with 4Fe4S-binding SPASM domain
VPALFEELSIETVGSCNRTCPTCERNSWPNRDAVAGRFGKQQRMPTELFEKVVADAVRMGFTGLVNLQHYNEPLQDPRIADLARYVKAQGVFREVYMHSNADLLTERKAKALDGVLDKIVVALYDETGGQALLGPARDKRRSEVLGMFACTRVEWATGFHVITHYSPYANLEEAIAEVRPTPCRREVRLRMIIDYRGEMLMCCDDIVGLWKLGNVREQSLEELWFSSKHQEIMDTLMNPGGREAYGFCRICPRPDTGWND